MQNIPLIVYEEFAMRILDTYEAKNKGFKWVPICASYEVHYGKHEYIMTISCIVGHENAENHIQCVPSAWIYRLDGVIQTSSFDISLLKKKVREIHSKCITTNAKP